MVASLDEFPGLQGMLPACSDWSGAALHEADRSKTVFANGGSSRTSDDACAQRSRVYENKQQLQYATFNPRGAQPCKDDGGRKNRDLSVQKFAAEYRSLRPWTGYGVDRCHVDVDSQMKYGKVWVSDPSKTQLPTRPFHAVPDLSRGAFMPITELRLKNGQNTSIDNECDPLAEYQFPVFHPTLQPVCTKHLIMPWPRGGENSRDIARSPEFMRALGYRHDGRMWVRSC